MIENVARCQAEKHERVFGVQCQLGAGHSGTHWALAAWTGGVHPHIWNGDDRVSGNSGSAGDV